MLASAMSSSFAAELTDQESQKSEINLWDHISPMKHCYDCHTVAPHTLQFITSHTMAERRQCSSLCALITAVPQDASLSFTHHGRAHASVLHPASGF